MHYIMHTVILHTVIFSSPVVAITVDQLTTTFTFVCLICLLLQSYSELGPVSERKMWGFLLCSNILQDSYHTSGNRYDPMISCLLY